MMKVHKEIRKRGYFRDTILCTLKPAYRHLTGSPFLMSVKWSKVTCKKCLAKKDVRLMSF